MIASERRESRIRIPRPGVMGLLRFQGRLRPSYGCFTRGGKPYPRGDFDWNVALQGLIAPAERKKGPGDRRGTEGYK